MSLRVATNEAKHDGIIFIRVPAEPGGWMLEMMCKRSVKFIIGIFFLSTVFSISSTFYRGELLLYLIIFMAM